MRPASRFWLWHLPVAVGGVAALLFAAGFWLALRGSIGEPIGSPPPPPRTSAPASRRPGERRILVLGDSLARGTGDIAGKGYAVEVLEFVRRRGPASLANLAVAGFESDDVRRLVESANVRSLVAGADLLLVSIGGNDLSRALPRGGSPAGAAVEVTEARARFARNLRAILARLREANVRAPIYLLGLYDPFGEQRGPRVGASVIVGWNAVLQETAISFPGVWVVPTFDLFEKRADRLAADRFHPNRAGYEAIAARVAQLIPPEL